MYLSKFDDNVMKYIHNEVEKRYGNYVYMGPDYSSTGFFYDTLVKAINKFELGNDIIEYLMTIDDDEYDMFCNDLEHKMLDHGVLEYK